jgi:integrase
MKIPEGTKRCKCRDGDGKELGAQCPKLRRKDGSWNPSHGTWSGKTDVPVPKGSPRAYLRAGGFGKRDDMTAWFAAAIRLLEIPESGPDGYLGRLEILSLINEARDTGAPLPSEDDLRLRYTSGAAFRPGTTGEYLKDWLGRHHDDPGGDDGEGDWSPSTYHGYKQITYHNLLPTFGRVPLEKLASKHIWDMIKGVDKENARIIAARASSDPEVRDSVRGRRICGPARKTRIVATISSALGEAASDEDGQPRLIAVNVAAGIRFGGSRGRGRGKRKKKAPPRMRPKLWTAEREAAWRKDYERRIGDLAEARRLEDPGELRETLRFQQWRHSSGRPGPVMVWRPEHAGAFLDAAEDSRMYALFTEYIYCALRRSEGVGQKWPEVNFETAAFMIGSVIVQAGWAAVEKDDAKTDDSEAWVRADTIVMDALRAQRRRQAAERLEWGPAWQDTGYVHTHENGEPYHPHQATHAFELLAFRCGLPPCTLRDIRHVAPTLALAAGTDIKYVSAMMRHSSVKMTGDVYAVILPEMAAAVSESVASMIPRRTGTR